MAKVGYIYQAVGDETLSTAREWMEEYGCVRIFSDSSRNEKLRPKFQEIKEILNRGDELVLAKFSNTVRETCDLSSLIELCRVKAVRIISIGDKIDSHGKLFPHTSAQDVLAMVGCLPEESLAQRQQNWHTSIIRRHGETNSTKVILKDDRELNIINMYHTGHTIDDIWHASGYASKASVFRILNKHGVELNRGKHSGPMGPRKSKG